MMVLLVLLLAAGTAFAGTTRVNHNAAGANFTAALEAMGTARNITLLGAAASDGGVSNPALSFQLGQILTSGNLLEVTLTGATFDGQSINVCGFNGAQNMTVATATPASGSTTFNFQSSFATATAPAVAVGNYVWFSNAACDRVAPSNMPFRLAATSAAAAPTVRIRNLTAGGIEVDTSTAVTLATIAAQYARTFVANAHIVDYLGTPGNGTNFTANIGPTAVTARSSGAINITRAGFGLNTTGAAPHAGLSVGATISLTDTVGWQGVTRVFLSNAATCAAADDVAGVNTPSGTVSLPIPTVNYDGTAAATAFGLCITGNGTDALAPRTIQASTALSISAGGVTPAPTAFTNVDVWTLNAYQTWVSWLVNAEGGRTFCLINNADTVKTAAVLLDVVSSEGATTTITNRNMGTIAPRTSNMATFTANSAALTGGTAVDLTALGANARYAPKLTVTTSPANVSVQCIQVDPVTGGRRPVNTLQNGGTWEF